MLRDHLLSSFAVTFRLFASYFVIQFDFMAGDPVVIAVTFFYVRDHGETNLSFSDSDFITAAKTERERKKKAKQPIRF